MLDKNILLGIIVSVIGCCLLLVSYLIKGEQVFYYMPERIKVTKEISGEYDDLHIVESKLPIIINSSSDDNVHIEAFISDNEYYQINSNTDISITEQNDKFFYQNSVIPYDTNKNYYLKVSVPDNLELEIDASNNSVTIEGVNTSIINVNVKNGDVILKNTNADNLLNISSSNGNITSDSVTGSIIDFSTQSGYVDVKNISTNNSFDIKTIDGNISVTDCKTINNFELESDSGTIILTNSEFYDALLETTRGSIYVSLLGQKNEYVLDFLSNSDAYFSDVDKLYEFSKKILKCSTLNGTIIVDCNEYVYNNKE